jgi:hypothetical protein
MPKHLRTAKHERDVVGNTYVFHTHAHIHTYIYTQCISIYTYMYTYIHKYANYISTNTRTHARTHTHTGDPTKALNIMGSGMNEHFSGVNAGTMFGDGIYLAEDMGKSDQYCRPLHAGAGAGLHPTLYPTPDTQHPAPYTLHPTLCIILPINTTKQNHGRLCKQR